MSPERTPEHHTNTETTDVLVVGAGPAGLMLAAQLVRAGIPVKIIDERAGRTTTGRADGLQPKTLETFKQLGIADGILRKGVKIYDYSFWNSYPGKKLHRTNRDAHFPPVVDVLEPYILLVHQGMIEELFLEDMEARGVRVQRSSTFDSYILDENPNAEYPVIAKYKHNGRDRITRAKYLVGCDGAHSAVRSSMPGNEMQGESVDVFWGVLDGVIETDFPDLWSKCIISSHDKGTILSIPRERNMTRLYIELSTGSENTKISKAIANQDFVMTRGKEILAPFSVDWKSVEWFGCYQIGQRIASNFSHANRVFIAGDASHTHSPKAAQGMNVSMHDTFNLAWKLSLVLNSVSPTSLLGSYPAERRKIAQDLISFDYEHANAFVKNNQVALAENFTKNIRFISGVGAVYDANTPLTTPSTTSGLGLIPGELLLPAKATRYIDTNPVDIQLDIPLRNQFRVYFLTSNYHSALQLLSEICEGISAPTTVISRASKNSLLAPHSPPKVEADEYIQPDRYIVPNLSRIFTFATITQSPQKAIEFTDLPTLLRPYKWTLYNDNLEENVSPTKKWAGKRGLSGGEVMTAVVRPDGYVGGAEVWRQGMGKKAVGWLEEYFKGVLAA
ncbi:phenol 2-monooxygenase [Tuber brumale]|nr:phenol 2-monooxygenase [Tuber brumale]